MLCSHGSAQDAHGNADEAQGTADEAQGAADEVQGGADEVPGTADEDRVAPMESRVPPMESRAAPMKTGVAPTRGRVPPVTERLRYPARIDTRKPGGAPAVTTAILPTPAAVDVTTGPFALSKGPAARTKPRTPETKRAMYATGLVRCLQKWTVCRPHAKRGTCPEGMSPSLRWVCRSTARPASPSASPPAPG